MRKKLQLTKSLLVAACLLLGGTSAWADDTEVTINCSSSITMVGTSSYGTDGSDFSSLIRLNSYAAMGGAGAMSFTLDNDWDASKVKSAILKIYPTSKPNKNRSGEIYIRQLDALPTPSETSTSYSEGKHIVYSYGGSNTKRYAFTTDKLATIAASAYTNSAPKQGEYYDVDLTTYFKGLTTKSAGDAVYFGIDISDFAFDTQIGAYGNANAPKLIITYATETLYTATFTETNSLTPTVTIYSDAGRTTEVSNGTLTNGTTYYYKATLTGYVDYLGSFTVSGANPSVSFTMTAKTPITYTKRAVCGSVVLNPTLATANGYEGEPITLAWSKYIKVDEKWYVATENTFRSSSTTDATEDVEYTLADIAYFCEMENLTRSGGLSVIEESDAYSGGKRIRLSRNSLYYTPALTGGLYTINIPWDNINNAANEVYVYTRTAGGDLSAEKLATFTATKGSGTFSAVVNVPDGYSLAFNGNEGDSYNNNARMDYMILESANVPVKIAASGYSTIASAYALDCANLPEGVTAFKVSSITSSAVTMDEVTTAVAAGTGLVLKGTANTTYKIPVVASGSAVSGNKLQAAVTATAVAANAAYVLKGGKFCLVTSASSVPAGKAYLLASDVPASASELNIEFGGDATGVNGVRSQMEEGRGEVFDLQGRRVAQPTKGLYIVNGRKMIIK